MTMAMFQAQLNTMVTWFDQWSESGQTVALFKMLTRLAPIQARFVAIALEHSLTECTELALREQEANNPGFVSGLLCESRETGMNQAIHHLPLLRPGNNEARHCYLTLISALLSYTVQTGCLVEEARQLLSYALIHPALKDDRKVFEQWRQSLGERIMLGNKAQALAAANELQQQKTRRSNSLTPPFAVTPNIEWTSQDDLSMPGGGGKVRRFSLSSEQCGGPPLSPQSSQASSGSGSETHLDADDNPAMRDVKTWLKSLRLHKYWRLFSQLSYEQMLSLNEDNFDCVVEQMGSAVTQGARRKIILSIAKLRDRSNLLAALEQDVMSGGNVVTAMEEMKMILATPIKAYPEDELSPPPYDDIPTQFTRLLGKVCTQVMVSSCTDEEALSVFLNLLDSALLHDAFTCVQKKKISSWRLQISQQIRQLGCDVRRVIVFSPPHRQLYTRPFAPRPTMPQSIQPHHLSPAVSPLLPPTPPQHLDIKQRAGDLGDSEPEINSRLESLCLSMTEHALGSPSDNM